MAGSKVQKAIAQLGSQLKRLEQMEEERESLIQLEDSLTGELVEVKAKIRSIDEDAVVHISGTGISIPAGAPKSLVQLPGRINRPRKMNKHQECLGDLLVRLMREKGEFSAVQGAKAALAEGYDTISQNFRDPVASLLSSDKRFIRSSRGRYRVRSGAKVRATKTMPRTRGDGPPVKPARTNGMTMADYIYRDAPKGEFCSDDLMDAIRKSGRCTRGLDDKALRKSISTRLSEDKRFRNLRLGVWVRVFPGDWNKNA